MKEEDIFWILVYIMEEKKVKNNFFANNEGAYEKMNKFIKLMEKQDKKLFNHFEERAEVEFSQF